jgi:superfamily I DNA and/or RNA helicase
MAYRSYLLDKFEFTHENRFFRQLDEKLKNNFEDGEGDHILIGNLNVGGNSLDALFIKRGAITVIDFKDYSGDLTFSVNGPWRLKTEKGNTIFVAGGAHSRNPFQQVNAYRFAVFQFLGEKNQEILDINHSDVSWAHTNGLVLFQREVKFDFDSIPSKIQRYFHISQSDKIVRDLVDLNSRSLNFSNTELQNILKVLNVTDTFLYKRDDVSSEVAIAAPIDPSRMDRIIKLIPNLSEESEIKRALGFYNTMLSIERINQASVQSIHHYPISWSVVDTNKHFINMEVNAEFLNVWLLNTTNNFPKNLFVSINLLFEGITVPFFYTIITHSDIENKKRVQLKFDNFDVYRPILEELELTEDIIEELTTSINQHQSIEDKIGAARTFLDVPLELVDRISFGLSTESLFTAQLQSELNQWIKGKKGLQENPVFKAMVTNTPIAKNINANNDAIFQITPLNQSQKKGINLSFSQPLTLITGPPGTGKSQVVTNILANAIIRGEKVLFSSKNNKAVDNVHQRISKLLEANYFLRLGTNAHNRELIDKLNGTISEISNGVFEDKSELLKIKKSAFDTIMKEKTSLVNQLKSIAVLEAEIPSLIKDLETNRQQYKEWVSSIDKRDRDLYLTNNLKFNITQTTLNELQRTVSKSKNGFISKINFNWFKKTGFINTLKTVNLSLPIDLQTYIDKSAPIISQKGDLIEGFSAHINFISSQKKIQEEISSNKNNLLQQIETISTDLKTKQESLTRIVSNKQQFQTRINEIVSQEPTFGIEVLELTINEKLRKANIGVIESYKNYISGGIPWRHEEQKECSNITNAFLELFNSISITSLNVKKAFLQEPEIFDLLVIDEASQCDITSAIPLMYRAKRIVVIGDSLQLPHITSIKKHEQQFVLEKLNLAPNKYNYINDSLFEKAKTVSNLSLFDSAFLDQHYRCHPDIIGFSNQFFYMYKAGHQLDIKTKPSDFKYGEPGIHWEDVKGQIHQSRNANLEEVKACVALARTLVKKYPEASIGIATPFKHQKETLKNALNDLPEKQNILCDVIHRFQGDEKDIIILSLVVTDNCKPSLPNFINTFSPYLLNVAITRAQSALYIVGNKDYCLSLTNNNGQKTLLSNLVSYETKINT